VTQSKTQNLLVVQQDNRFDCLDRSLQNVIAKVLELQSTLNHKNGDWPRRDAETLQVKREDIRGIIADVLCYPFETPESDEFTPSKPRDFNNSTTTLGSSSTLRRIHTSTSTSIFNPTEVQYAGKLFRSLRFDTMEERFDEISEAHDKTFQWVLKDRQDRSKAHWDDYVEWLRSGTKIYWIYGKAGSGKSTLMKHIFDDSQARELLEQWSTNLPLIVAGHFFWKSGTSDQKSYKGLLRSLLFQALKAQPYLIPLVLLERKGGLDMEPSKASDPGLEIIFERAWTLKTLKDSFLALMNQKAIPFKLCLFVDGLDEYEGDFVEIAQFFTKLADSASENIKICLSSRPLLVFEDAFSGMPSLKLQELTKDDIRNFVQDKLTSNHRWTFLANEKPERSQSLMSQIISKADGVFLWVNLVVTSLLAGLTNRDDISDLEKRLGILPEDLEKLYMHMLTNIKPEFYLEQASRIFQLVRQAQLAHDFIENLNLRLENPQHPLTIYQLSLAFNCNYSSAGGMSTKFLVQTIDKMLLESQTMADRLKTRCAGLLEIGEVVGDVVDSSSDNRLDQSDRYSIRSPLQVVVYIHRTAKDFLDRPDVWNTILSHTSKEKFDPCTALFRANVAFLKGLDNLTQIPRCLAFKPGRKFDMNPEWVLVYRTILYGALVNENDAIELFEELDQIMAERHKFCRAWTEHWIDHSPLAHTTDITHRENSSLSLAIEGGLFFYVKHRLKQQFDIAHRKAGRPLLEYAVDSRHIRLVLPSRVKIVSLLLQHGCSPNSYFRGGTTWQTALYQAISDCHLLHTRKCRIGAKDTSSLWLEVITYLVQHQADPDALVQVGKRSEPAAWVVYHIFVDAFPVDARDLRDQLLRPKREINLQASDSKD
jgi:hypothetical protein